jgi:type II secretory pathway pseudopilin PulG
MTLEEFARVCLGMLVFSLLLAVVLTEFLRLTRAAREADDAETARRQIDEGRG